jgi:hypothetical protein
MIYYFALLDEPRRPWLEVEALKARFHALSNNAHPDRVHSSGSAAEKQMAASRYADLNSAYQCLRDPKERLRHLLALEYGGKPGGIERVPAGDLELFMQVGQLCRETDVFLAERATISAPMLKVRMFQGALEWTDRLQRMVAELNRRRTSLDSALLAMNPAWEAAPQPGDPNRAASLPLDQLEQNYRTLSFLARWTAQLQERIVQLSL